MVASPKQQFREAFEREHDTTMRVLRAYPDDQGDFRPHARSRTAREVAWPIALGQERLMVKALTTGFDWSKPPGAPPPAPERMSALAAAVQEAHGQALRALDAADEGRLSKTVSFFVGPKQMADIPVGEFLWFLLHDHIHHRGQLSVYLRIVGKVPPIYGPSGDEPWT